MPIYAWQFQDTFGCFDIRYRQNSFTRWLSSLKVSPPKYICLYPSETISSISSNIFCIFLKRTRCWLITFETQKVQLKGHPREVKIIAAFSSTPGDACPISYRLNFKNPLSGMLSSLISISEWFLFTTTEPFFKKASPSIPSPGRLF